MKIQSSVFLSIALTLSVATAAPKRDVSKQDARQAAVDQLDQLSKQSALELSEVSTYAYRMIHSENVGAARDLLVALMELDQKKVSEKTQIRRMDEIRRDLDRGRVFSQVADISAWSGIEYSDVLKVYLADRVAILKSSLSQERKDVAIAELNLKLGRYTRKAITFLSAAGTSSMSEVFSGWQQYLNRSSMILEVRSGVAVCKKVLK